MEDKNLEKESKDIKKQTERRNIEDNYEVGEDSTKYGEFISSYFAWISLPNQKERAEELQNMTKKSKNEKK